jgi:Nuclease-related domain
MSLLVWAGLLAVYVVLFVVALPSRWSLLAGMLLGGAIALWITLPDALMPNWIRNWQIGSWGEQATGKQLGRLPAGWVTRNDRAGRSKWNRDHVVTGPAVYVLDTKNLSDSVVTVEGAALRVTPREDPEHDGYLLDRFPERWQAKELRREAETALGFSVAIYPVIVLWAKFEVEAVWLGDLAVVRGDRIATWLTGRPVDLLADDRRASVSAWVRSLPRA